MHRTEDKLEQLLEATAGGVNTAAPAKEEKAFHPPLQKPSPAEHQAPLWRGEQAQKRPSHLAALHRVLLWPAVSTLLHTHGVEAASDLADIAQTGTGWFMQQELEKHSAVLPPRFGLHAVPLDGLSSDGLPRVTFPSLTKPLMKQYADQYFSTYNMLYPVLDYSHFMQEVLPKVAEEGFGDGCFKSVIALLVFALGKVADEGTFGKPIAIKGNGIPAIRGWLSGMRGGTADAPPALEIFNEAQRRLGFVVSHICLENAQTLLLRAYVYRDFGIALAES